MSYDLYLLDPVTREQLETDEKHLIVGGTYAIDGTEKLWLNITYNYSEHFAKAFGHKDGVRTIYGMQAADSIPVLESAISKLGDDVSDDYWEATEGNAKRSLYGLLALAKLRPDGIWDGD